MKNRFLAIGLFLLFFSCEWETLSSEQSSFQSLEGNIVGGKEVFPDRFRAVGSLARLRRDGTFFSFCTGTLIAPNFVLTAAHCLQGGNPEEIFFLIGTRSDLFEEALPVKRLSLSARFENDALGRGNDIGLVELAESTFLVEPIPLQREFLDDSFLGKTFTAVGFGITDTGRNDGGIKRAVDMVIDDLERELIFYGTKTLNICSGDSGGPDLMEFDGEFRVIGIHSFGTSSASAEFCHNTSASQRVDVKVERFIEPAMEVSGTGFGCVEDEFCETPCPVGAVDTDCEVQFAKGCTVLVLPTRTGNGIFFLFLAMISLVLCRKRFTLSLKTTDKEKYLPVQKKPLE